MAIKNAIISVYDKTGLDELARALVRFGIKIYSSGGTANYLRQRGIKVEDISRYTGFPELLEGRVKTLHPRVLAGILADRQKTPHLEQLQEHAILRFDLIVVIPYPFEDVIKGKGVSLEKVIEYIDIGGPTLLRSAAKNFSYVAVVCDKVDYPLIIQELEKNNGEIPFEIRKRLAAKAFELTSRYDHAISRYLTPEQEIPESLQLILQRVCELRYGENPHQRAGLYRLAGYEGGIVDAEFIESKQLSYNNILDAVSGMALVNEFERPTCAIIKHNNPCGVASSSRLWQAFRMAYMCDPESAFGGIVCFNRGVDRKVASEMVNTGKFFEVIVAPEYAPKSIEILGRVKWGKKLRILRIPGQAQADLMVRSIGGGVLVQTPDNKLYENIRWVTGKKDRKILKDLLFAYKVVKHVRSNAIVVAKGEATLGIGVGQTSRIKAVKIAIKQAGRSAKGGVMASDGFFPFPDVIKFAKRAGIVAIIQPGGSIRDKEVMESARRAKIRMVLTGTRHFCH
jgi:phosphoribosylaminoimidazolecarboxamide formyltransferase/IMP cyclohydrolase